MAGASRRRAGRRRRPPSGRRPIIAVNDSSNDAPFRAIQSSRNVTPTATSTARSGTGARVGAPISAGSSPPRVRWRGARSRTLTSTTTTLARGPLSDPRGSSQGGPAGRRSSGRGGFDRRRSPGPGPRTSSCGRGLRSARHRGLLPHHRRGLDPRGPGALVRDLRRQSGPVADRLLLGGLQRPESGRARRRRSRRVPAPHRARHRLPDRAARRARVLRSPARHDAQRRPLRRRRFAASTRRDWTDASRAGGPSRSTPGSPPPWPRSPWR